MALFIHLDVQLQNLSSELLIFDRGNPFLVYLLHLLYKGLGKLGQGSAAATQAALVGLLLLRGVRHGQTGQLLVQS